MTQQMVAKLQKNKVIELFNSILNEKKVQDLLKKLEDYHKETYEHSLRVGFLSMFLGAENNLSEEDIKLLCYAGLLHDLGKLDIPKKILNKKSKLTDVERKKIEEHSEKGFLRLKDFEKVREIVIQHHKYQKNSYPKNYKINEFYELAQIVAIADMYDALSNKRSYKKALDNDKVKKILEKTFTGEKIYIEQIVSKKDGDKNNFI
jgi:putative nucleotidyltransferase with HDIG domain